MPLTVEVNGKSKTLQDLAAGASLQELVVALDLKADRIAIERNGKIVPRDARGSVRVDDGDRLEIVHFVGGGAEIADSRDCHATTIQNICYQT